MRQGLGSDRMEDELVRQTALLADLVGEADPELAVPSCLDWTVGELTVHVGLGHRWATGIIASRASGPVPNFSLLYDYTLGFALSGPTSINEQRLRDAETRSRLHTFLRSLPPDRFPALVALGAHVWVDNRDERFTAGLDTLIDGLQTQRRRRQRNHQPKR
jgi:hypothetical protein